MDSSKKFRYEKLFKKLLAGLWIIALIAGGLVLAGPPPVSAEEATVLTVRGNGVEHQVEFTLSDLQALPQKTYTYSGYNHWPSLVIFRNMTGPSLQSILDAAGLKDNATLIRVRPAGGVFVDYSVEQILETPRYYFPDGEDTPGDVAVWPPNRSDAGKSPVETIIALNNGNGRLMFGQVAWNEPSGGNCVLLADLCKGGAIEVTTDPLEQWPTPFADIPSGSVPPGTLITLSNPEGAHDNCMIYYTLDGSEPTYGSNIFNISWPTFRPEDINKPIPIYENVTIKARTIHYGKLDSEVVTYQYSAGTPALTIQGTQGTGISQPVRYTLERLKSMSPHTGSYQYSAGGTPVTLNGKGVLLRTLLDQMTISNKWEVTFIAVDGQEYPGGTVQDIIDQQCLLAYEVNGQDVADVMAGQTVNLQILRNSGSPADNRLKHINSIRLTNVDDEITIENVRLLDYTGRSINAVSAGGGYCIEAQLTNKVGASKDALLLIQVRNGTAATATAGGSVVGFAAVQTVADTDGEKLTAEFTLPAWLSGRSYVDVFVYAGADDYYPLGQDKHMQFNIE